MSVAPHSDQAPATTPPTSSQSAAAGGTGSGTGWPKLARGEIPSTWSKPAEVVTTVPSRAKGALPLGPIVGVVVAVGTAAFVFVAMPNLGTPAASTTAASAATASAATASAATASTATASTATTGAATTSAATTSASTATASTATASTTMRATDPPVNAVVIAPTTSPATTATAPTTASTNAAASAATIARVDVAEAIPAPPPTSSTTPHNAVAPEDQGGDANADAAGAGDVVTELPARKKAKGLTARAITALRGGDVAGAEPLLVRAVLVDPSLADAWRHLGIARAQLGDVDGARRAYRKYLELAPKAPDAAQVRAILAAP